MIDLIKKMENVALFEKGDRQFWQEPYIAGQLLATHLDQKVELASRKLTFIEKSVGFIKADLVGEGGRIIDFGCGPGLYCQQFGKQYQVTGVDFSENSIAYAKKVAVEKQLAINYYCQNYLEWQGDQSNDLALLIYCDYGALDQQDRQRLLAVIYDSLKIGGKLILDVFSLNKFKTVTENRDWGYWQGPGFWRSEAHGVVSQVKKYPGAVTLEQSLVVTANERATYNIWYQFFDEATLLEELISGGFSLVNKFSDVMGKPYSEISQTIAVVVEKR